MFLYYQQSTAKDDEGNGESWKYVKDSAESRKALAEKQVHMVSMLAISNVQYDADYEQLKYRGDLYFDIDSDDLNISIASTQELVAKLRQFGVYDIVVYLSGKKGFHVTVPSKVFSQNTSAGIKWLPYIYGHMAFRHFAVEGLDPSVYSGGKGRLWRQPNVKRLDNGAYKVPVRPEDLEGMDAARYQELVSKPNFELMSAFDRAEPVYSLELATAFEEALN